MRRTFLLLCWLITDIILFLGAYAAAYFLRVGFIISTDFPFDLYMRTVLIIAPLWLGVMWMLGVFRLTRIQSNIKNLTYILFACVMGISLFTITYYLLYRGFFSRLLLVEAGVISLAITVIWHLAFDQWQRRVLRKSPPAYPVLFVGINREAARFIKTLNERMSPLTPIGILDAMGSSEKEIEGIPVLGKLNMLEEVIKKYRPSHLVQCANLEQVINLMSVCRNHGMTYMLLPSVLGAVRGNEETDMIEGQPVVTIRE